MITQQLMALAAKKAIPESKHHHDIVSHGIRHVETSRLGSRGRSGEGHFYMGHGAKTEAMHRYAKYHGYELHKEHKPENTGGNGHIWEYRNKTTGHHLNINRTPEETLTVHHIIPKKRK